MQQTLLFIIYCRCHSVLTATRVILRAILLAPDQHNLPHSRVDQASFRWTPHCLIPETITFKANRLSLLGRLGASNDREDSIYPLNELVNLDPVDLCDVMRT